MKEDRLINNLLESLEVLLEILSNFETVYIS